MRDPERIDKVLNIIRLVWSECPDMNLTQLIVKSLGMSDQVLSYKVLAYIGDEILVKKLAEYGMTFVRDETEDKLLVQSGILDDLIKEDKSEEYRSWKDFLENWEKEVNTTNA